MSKHIVILGAGYGGLLSALTVRKYMDKDAAKVTVINQYPTHQIITELHRLAAGNVSEQRIAMPLEKLFKGKDIDLKIAKVDSFNVERDGNNTALYSQLPTIKLPFSALPNSAISTSSP